MSFQFNFRVGQNVLRSEGSLMIPVYLFILHYRGLHIVICIGGLLCRAMIETVAGHNVHNFVSLSAPMMGQFGRKLHNICYILISMCMYSLRLHTDSLPQLHCRSLVLVCIHCIMHTAAMYYAVG